MRIYRYTNMIRLMPPLVLNYLNDNLSLREKENENMYVQIKKSL